LIQSDLKKKINDLSSSLDKKISSLKQSSEKDIKDFQKDLKKDFDDLKKKVENGSKLEETQLETISKEIRNIKKDFSLLKDQEKTLINDLRNDVKEISSTSQKYTEKRVVSVNSDIEEMKKNIVKLMEVLREKLVSKETFEKRNASYEKLLSDVLEQTKDLDKVKVSYFARTNVNDQIEESQSKIKKVEQNLNEIRDEQSKLARASSFEDCSKSINELKEQIESINKKNATLASEETVQSVRSTTDSSLQEQKASLQTLTSKLNVLENSLSSMQEWKKDIQLLQITLDKQNQKVLQNETKINLIQDMNLTSPISRESERKSVLQGVSEFFVEEQPQPKTDVVKEVNTMLDERAETETYTPPVMSKEEPGFFSKMKTGVVNFFFEEVEEESPVVVEEEKKKVEQPLEEPQPEKKEPKEDKPKKAPPKRKETSTPKHYMQSRKPRIFDEIESSEEGSRKRKYKRVEGGDEPIEDLTEEKILYPEDYFY